ncbi:carbon-nitrogen hydrolase family protein [Bacillota bacterium LX-D]|nr:carbon-nitrogen hydrolase family protein [Bacillota bacterium LX-D]
MLKVANLMLEADDTYQSVEEKIQNLAQKGVKLILLPALAGFFLYCREKNLGACLENWADLCRDPAIHKGSDSIFLARCASIAQKLCIYLGTGTSLVWSKNSFEHQSLLLNPTGNICGQQSQTHVSKSESQLPIKLGNDLTVWDLPFGKVGFCVSSDIFYPEVSRILAWKGADLILAPAISLLPYNPWRQVAAMWQEVQQNQFFCLENWLNVPLGRLKLGGKAPILGPCQLTPGQTGYLTEGISSSSAQLDFTALTQVRQEYPLLKQLNYPAYAKYFPQIYAKNKAK